MDSITITDVVFQDVLAVGQTGGVLVRIIDLAGGIKSSFPMPASGFIRGLTHLPAADPADQKFAFLDDAPSGTSVVITDSGGGLDQSCDPSGFQLPSLDKGITYDPFQGTFLTSFEDGLAREISLTCGPTVGDPQLPQNLTFFAMSLASLGEGFDTPGFSGGVAVADNTLLVCGMKSKALFQLLIFPAGPDFLRGDFNGSNSVNLTDAIASADYLFKLGPGADLSRRRGYQRRRHPRPFGSGVYDLLPLHSGSGASGTLPQSGKRSDVPGQPRM